MMYLYSHVKFTEIVCIYEKLEIFTKFIKIDSIELEINQVTRIVAWKLRDKTSIAFINFNTQYTFCMQYQFNKKPDKYYS